MIKLFEKVIKEQAPAELTKDSFPLDYLKFSTVTSGSGPYDKVIFLVFKNQESAPFLCLKTVRSYAGRQAIVRNFENLKKLNNLTVGSPQADLFARAIYLYDDQENVFSIETACLGKKKRLDQKLLGKMMEDYISFQERAAGSGGKTPRTFEQLARESIVNCGLDEHNQGELNKYVLSRLLATKVLLPRVIQHGDLTLDNLLFVGDRVRIVDYDFVGSSDIPGFDLFGLFRRLGNPDFLELVRVHFPKYFKRIGGEIKGDSYSGLIFLYHLIEHTQGRLSGLGGVTAKKIISDFERLYPKS